MSLAILGSLETRGLQRTNGSPYASSSGVLAAALPLPAHGPWPVGPQGLSGLRRLCTALDRQDLDPKGEKTSQETILSHHQL